jgi:hypothetical protein
MVLGSVRGGGYIQFTYITVFNRNSYLSILFNGSGAKKSCKWSKRVNKYEKKNYNFTQVPQM